VLQDRFLLRCLSKNLIYASASDALIKDGLPAQATSSSLRMRWQISSALPVPAGSFCILFSVTAIESFASGSAKATEPSMLLLAQIGDTHRFNNDK